MLTVLIGRWRLQNVGDTCLMRVSWHYCYIPISLRAETLNEIGFMSSRLDQSWLMGRSCLLSLAFWLVMTLLQCWCHNKNAFWTYFFLLTLVFVLQWLFFHWKILIMLMSQFPLTFHQIHNGMPCFITWLMTSLVLLMGMVFMIIW